MVQVDQTIWVRQAGKMKLEGDIAELSVFMRKERVRLDRLLKTRIRLKKMMCRYIK